MSEDFFVSDAEAQAAWARLCREHLVPSYLFQIAKGLQQKTTADLLHLCRCASCRQAYLVYLSK